MGAGKCRSKSSGYQKDEEHGGILEFGTEVVAAADGSIAALLGASPGASTAVSIMISLLEKCFKTQMNSEEWQLKLKEIIPSYKNTLSNDAELCREIRKYTTETLKLRLVNASSIMVQDVL
jgi:malate dehydrogenase (quinone)